MEAFIELEAVIEQHHPDLPWYVALPEQVLSGLGTLVGTTTVEGTIKGVDLGRRGMKRWGPERPGVWFFEVPKQVWSKAGLSVGDRVQLRLRRASEDLPVELSQPPGGVRVGSGTLGSDDLRAEAAAPRGCARRQVE